MSEYKPDSIIQSVVDKFISRGELGLKKYGTTLDREDLSVVDWINHAIEEHMDAILYLEKLKKTLSASVVESSTSVSIDLKDVKSFHIR